VTRPNIDPARLASIEAEAVADFGPMMGPRFVRLALAIAGEILAARPDEEDADPLVPHDRWTFCSSRRAACELARSGAIEGATLVGQGRGRRWVARRSALDAYVSKHGKPVADHDPKPANDAGPGEVDDLLAQLRAVPASAPRMAKGGDRG
jgi:hypothetical protein